jgi:hypothetical protein
MFCRTCFLFAKLVGHDVRKLCGIGWGEAANDDWSDTALVMELARILSAPNVTTDRSIRFILWNNEESRLDGARAYVAQRQPLQGKESPAGSGKYPEPRWLGMIQHDMMMFDHGMPRADHTVSKEQRPEADVNIEFQSNSKMAHQSQKLAWFFQNANEKFATDYPATVGRHMTNTDSRRSWTSLRRSAFARTSVARISELVGIRIGISRPTCTQPIATTISVLV